MVVSGITISVGIGMGMLLVVTGDYTLLCEVGWWGWN